MSGNLLAGITITDGSSGSGTPGPPGADGEQGPPGLVGQDGQDGATGIPGRDGADGATGATGATGADGAIGIGLPGQDGQDGISGIPGQDGVDGAEGARGVPGQDGQDGDTRLMVGVEEADNSSEPRGVVPGSIFVPANTSRIVIGPIQIPDGKKLEIKSGGRYKIDSGAKVQWDLAAGSPSTRAPLRFTAGARVGFNADVPLRGGEVEFDGSCFYATPDTFSGRGIIPAESRFFLTANGATIGTTLTDYFGANSAAVFRNFLGRTYLVKYYLYFSKTTAGILSFKVLASSVLSSIRASYLGTNIGGESTVGAPQHAGINSSNVSSVLIPATGLMGDGGESYFEITVIFKCSNLVTNLITQNIRLQVSNSAGTITPGGDSYYTLRTLPANGDSIGFFVP